MRTASSDTIFLFNYTNWCCLFSSRFFAHNTWSSYYGMTRVWKQCAPAFNLTRLFLMLSLLLSRDSTHCFPARSFSLFLQLLTAIFFIGLNQRAKPPAPLTLNYVAHLITISLPSAFNNFATTTMHSVLPPTTATNYLSPGQLGVLPCHNKQVL